MKKIDNTNKELLNELKKLRLENATLKKIHNKDINTRKQAEDASLNNEERLTLALEVSNAGIWEWNIASEIVSFDERFHSILGYKPGELPDKLNDWLAYHHEGDLPIMLSKANAYLRGDSPIYESEHRIRTKAGSWAWVFTRGQVVNPTSIESGKQFIGIAMNITERKLEQEALIAQKQFTDKLIESLPGIFYMYDDNLKLRRWNRNHETIMGYSAHELSNFLLRDCKISGEIDTTVEDVFRKIITDKNSANTIIRAVMPHKDGTKVPYLLTGVRLDTSDGPMMVGIGIDIKDWTDSDNKLRVSEANLRTLLNTIPDLVWLKDPEGIYLKCNFRFENLFGTTEKDIVGKTDYDFLDKDIADFFRENDKRAVIARKPTMNEELVVFTNDGHREFLETIKTPIFANDGKLIGVLGIGRDITGRKQTEKELELYHNHLEEVVKVRTEELDEANKSLKREIEKEKEYEMMLEKTLDKEKELSEMKSRFISTTSHEFRTPLTAVQLSADLMKIYGSKWDSEKRIEHLDRIISSVKYLTKLLDDILILGRAESGKISYKPERIDLYKFAKDRIEDAKSIMKKKHKIVFNCNSEQIEHYVDPKLVRFIFNNLLSNAIKYSPNGGVIELTISTEQQDLIIEVKDNGVGIPGNEIGKIFDSFYRGKNVEEITGTGLGLAIVKRAVDLHSGEISVSSDIDKGTTFTVKIPKAVLPEQY